MQSWYLIENSGMFCFEPACGLGYESNEKNKRLPAIKFTWMELVTAAATMTKSTLLLQQRTMTFLMILEDLEPQAAKINFYDE